jgi:WD40 repeat protein
MASCPSRKDLDRFLREALGEAELTSILIHVEDCPKCQETLDRLADDAPWPAELPPLSVFARIAVEETSSDAEAFFARSGRGRRPEDSEKPDVAGYDILEEIGRGATGVVYRARQRRLNRLVALKVIAAGPYLSPDVRKRFRREAQTVARLQHPNIVQIYDVGEETGYLYLALELVEGGSLTGWLGGTPKGAPEAARLVARLAGAIDYAHGQGVVHRDLKPANILMGDPFSELQSDESPPRAHNLPETLHLHAAVPKVTDFGVAKLLSGPGPVQDRMTQSGAILGTPAYAAPEQAAGHAAEVGPTADVYSLGVILYELMTGRPPFQGANPMETLVQVVHQEPVPPARLVPKVPRDLRTICLKCLEKDPRKRYATARELAADLERFLAHQPVLARPLGWRGRSLRWARRHKGLAAALFGVALLLVVLAAGSLGAAAYFQKQEKEQRALALEKANLADEKGRLIDEKEAERQKAVAAERRESHLRQVAVNQGAELRRNLYFAQMNLAEQATNVPGGLSRVIELLAPAQRDRPDLRHWEWYYLNSLCHRERLTLRGHDRQVLGVAWSPDGRQLASAGGDGLVLIWDAALGQEVRALHYRSGSRALAWSPDGSRVVSANSDGTIVAWRVASGKELLSFRAHTGEARAIAWSPDGKRLATGGSDRVVQVWDAADGSNIHVLRGHTRTVRGLAWSPDGKRLASGSEDRTVRLWDALAGKEVLTLAGHLNWVTAVAWSPNGTWLASASNDPSVKVWDPTLGKEVFTLRGYTQAVRAVAWSPDSTHLVTGSEDSAVTVRPATGGPAEFTLRGHTAACTSVAWSGDGKSVASAAADATVKIWNAVPVRESVSQSSQDGPVQWVAWRPDSQCFAKASSDGSIGVWDKSGEKEPFFLRGHEGPVRSVAWSPDGKRLASSGADRTIRIWDPSSRKQVSIFRGHTDGITSVSWSPDGTLLASASFDKAVRVWDASTGTSLRIGLGHEHWVNSVTWSPDGKRLASASWDRIVKVWDAATLREVLTMRGHVGEVSGVAWSADGHSLASAGRDGQIKIWDANSGKPTATLHGHSASVNAVVWSPDGGRLASASWDGTVKIWDPATGEEALTLGSRAIGVDAVAWSPDGLALVAGREDGTVAVYDATAGYVAGRAPQYLHVLDCRLAVDPTNAADWRLRGEIHASMGDWQQAAADFKRHLALDPRSHWLTLDWRVAGPYPDDLNQSYAPERDSGTELQPAVSVEGNSTRALNWQSIPMNARGFVNFGALYAEAEHISAYARLQVYSPRQQRVLILVGSDDKIRLWLNGKQIHEYLQERAAKPDADTVATTLSEGWNTLLARVVNVTGKHELYLRLSDAPED